MKLTRRYLRRLIESIINESEPGGISRSEGMLGMVRPLVVALHVNYDLDEAESIVQRIGTDDVTLNEIDSVYRSRFHELAKEYPSLEMITFGSASDRVEKGIAYAIFKLLRRLETEAYAGIDTIDSDYDKGIPDVYVKATQEALKDYPGLLALFNTNK